MVATAPVFRLLCLLTLAGGLARGQTFITPTSATASTEYSSLYDIGNTIDGSGLPGGFGLSDLHADYAADNHWTTNGPVIANEFAIYFFSSGQSLTHFYLWNHRSNIIAFSPFYYVTQFDLIFRDSGNNVITSVNDLTAVGGTAAVQTFIFGQVDNVWSVVFDIDSNAGESVTGVAEVRFGLVAVPEPGATGLAIASLTLLAVLGQRRRSRRAA